jgi:hypothetical protein
MGLFRKRRNSIEPLAVDHAADQTGAVVQDNEPGHGARDIEEIEHAEGMRQFRQATRGPNATSHTGGQMLDPLSSIPRLIPNDSEDNE